MEKRTGRYEDLNVGKELSLEQRKESVYNNWVNVAKKYGEQPDATIRDLYLRELNTLAVIQYLQEDDSIIDIGCGNGFATAEYAKIVRQTIGIDYIEGFVEKSKELHTEIIADRDLSFIVGDILDLSKIKEEYGQFDKVISERTLINLASWDEQRQALDQLSSLLEVGGLLLLTEVTLQGHERVDEIRQQFNLPILEKHWNNVYIDEVLLLDYLLCSGLYTLVVRESFSLYTLLSRVVNAVLALPNEPSFDAPVNEIAFRLSQKFSIENGPGYHVLFVFRKC